MIRFCTSRSLNTRITSARLSDNPTNSICVIDACCARGRVTTPASLVTFDSNFEAAATSALESSRAAPRSRRTPAAAGVRGSVRAPSGLVRVTGGARGRRRIDHRLERAGAVAGQPVVPVFEAGLERALDEQPAKSGAVDEEVALDDAIVLK